MTEDLKNLKQVLSKIDGKGYKAYKDLKGKYGFPDFDLFIDHVQGDPFAVPSKLRVVIKRNVAGFPKETYSSESRSIGVANYLARKFSQNAKILSEISGSGKSGQIQIDKPGQEVLPISAVSLKTGEVEARFNAGLPAKGRRILGKMAEKILLEKIPKIVNSSLIYKKLKAEEVLKAAKLNEDADWLRGELSKNGLIAFVADGSILPRKSGIDERPLEGDDVIKFESPQSLKKEFKLPNKGRVTGMGVPKGVTIIVGGGYHGKSTLLNAVERGVYNHLPGDGRDLVISVEDGVKIRAEDGRSVSGVDISSFIKNLPYGRSTENFNTTNASGSTSQAVNIIEALGVDTSFLMIDEDTSATNFMIRDYRMQELVAKENEPITPFIDKAKTLFKEHGISTILVIGGSGDYLDIADTVISMKNYYPEDVTEQARKIVEDIKTGRVNESDKKITITGERIPLIKEVIGKEKIKVRGKNKIQLGKDDIDLSSIEQIVDSSQTQAIADALIYISNNYADSNLTIGEVSKKIVDKVSSEGLDVLNQYKSPSLAYFRPHELAATINRIRTLKLK